MDLYLISECFAELYFYNSILLVYLDLELSGLCGLFIMIDAKFEKVGFVFILCVGGQESISSSYLFHQGSLFLLINFESNLSVYVNEINSWRFWRSRHLAQMVPPDTSVMFNSLRTNK